VGAPIPFPAYDG
nr:Chain C, Substrate Analogue [synthetic construct]